MKRATNHLIPDGNGYLIRATEEDFQAYEASKRNTFSNLHQRSCDIFAGDIAKNCLNYCERSVNQVVGDPIKGILP